MVRWFVGILGVGLAACSGQPQQQPEPVPTERGAPTVETAQEQPPEAAAPSRPPPMEETAPDSEEAAVTVPAKRRIAVPSKQKQKVKPKSRDPYACQESKDCVISCPKVAGCCGWPCGCTHAINKEHVASFKKKYAKTCKRPPCPAVGCAYEPAMGASCRNNRCVPTKGPGF